MHGIGNDFVVFDFIEKPQKLTPGQIRFIADRQFGVGCDQVLTLEKSGLNEADVLYRIYNADGGEVEQCGNGARCIAAFLRDRHAMTADVITAETTNGLIHLYNEADGQIRVNMGVPEFEPVEIPFQANKQEKLYSITLDGQEQDMSVLSVGNPHAVFPVEDVEQAPLEAMGPAVQQNSLFPDSVNVGFMQILDEKTIRLRVYERGVGETLACGTGACAAMVAGRLNYDLAEEVTVKLPGGDLLIRWQGEGEPVWMIGSAIFVYEGNISI